MSIRESILADLRAHPREGLLAQGFWALQIYRLGHSRFRMRSRLVRGMIRVIHLMLNKFAEIFLGISIGDSAVIGRGLTIEHFGGIVIHGSTRIGDNCLIRQGVTIGNRYMDRPLEAPIIGNNVVIGAGAKILGKVHVGDNAVIGANAVVLKDVPSGATAVGVPATVIKISKSAGSAKTPRTNCELRVVE